MNLQTGKNSKFVRKVNRMTILNIIKEHEPLSRQELAEITGLTPPAVTGIIRELLESNFVQETGLGVSQGGRKPVKLRLNAEAGYVLGIEVTHRKTILAVANLTNTPEVVSSVQLDMSDPSEGIAGLVELCEKTLHLQRKKGQNFMAVGIAFPGLIDTRQGTVKRSINLGPQWHQVALRKKLSASLGLPVYLENNSNASVLAERWFGEGRQVRDLVYVNLGEGISAGIMANDSIIQGFQGHAGEIGHSVLDEAGPQCNCGNRGCLEAYCGSLAITKQVLQQITSASPSDVLGQIYHQSGDIRVEDIIAAGIDSEGIARLTLQDLGRRVGVAIAQIINLYNPEAIFIGGQMAEGLQVFQEPLWATVQRRAFPEVVAATKLQKATFGDRSGVIGACALALQGLFEPAHSSMLDEAIGVTNTD